MLGIAAAVCAMALAAFEDRAPPPPRAPASPAEALHLAVRSNNLAEVQHLVKAGAPLEGRDSFGSTPLLDAAWEGNTEIGSYLIAQGADVNARHTEAGSTPLQYAVLRGNAALVRLLLAAGAATSGVDRSGQTLLHVAAARGNVPVLDLLLDTGKMDVQTLDSNGNTPLDSAVLQGHQNAVTALLRHHADAKYVHPLDGRGALHETCLRGFASLLEPLLAAGADLNGRDRFGQTPLDLALAYKNGKVVAALLKLGQPLARWQTIAEETMEAATLRGQTEIVRLLLENGFDVNQPAQGGAIYLSDAALKGQKKLVQLLLEHGASVGARNQTGGTALHDAALGGNADVVKLLLDSGAEINDRDLESGVTPLMMAAAMERAAVIRLLLARGADSRMRDKAGHTALDRARSTENAEIVSLLQLSPEKIQ